MEEGLRGVWRKDLGFTVVFKDYEKSSLKLLRGVWRNDLGFTVVFRDYEKSSLE